MFRFSCRWIDCWNAELQLKCKQICIRCMHKTLQYLFCAHLLVKKRWTEKFAFLSGEKKMLHTGDLSSNNNKRWFTSAFFFQERKTYMKEKNRTFFTMHWPLHTLHHNSFSLFDVSSPSCLNVHGRVLSIAGAVLCFALLCYCYDYTICALSYHGMACSQLMHSLTDCCAHKFGQKRHLFCSAKFNRSWKEILGKDTHTHGSIHFQHTNDEKRWEEIDSESEKRRAKKMEMQRIESESLKYAFSDFSVYFSDDLRYLRLNALDIYRALPFV